MSNKVAMVKGKIIGQEGGIWRAETENGQYLRVDEASLPDTLKKEGVEFYLSFHPIGVATDQDEARSLLNHLLGAA